MIVSNGLKSNQRRHDKYEMSVRTLLYGEMTKTSLVIRPREKIPSFRDNGKDRPKRRSFPLFKVPAGRYLYPPISKFGRNVTIAGKTMINTRAKIIEPIKGRR